MHRSWPSTTTSHSGHHHIEEAKLLAHRNRFVTQNVLVCVECPCGGCKVVVDVGSRILEPFGRQYAPKPFVTNSWLQDFDLSTVF